ncbi:MAG: CCA tRNA nucleotidyltransferase [Parvibaculaceae bacterium]
MLSEGGSARVAGGAVRNALMEHPVADIDIATTHRPERVMELAQAAGLSVHPTGLAHGTVTVVADGGETRKAFEVTTLRVDEETDGRHARVAFTDDWQADARRRDFTINALYCDAQGHVSDPVGGYPDIIARRVRFVGDPQARIREDYLRILRFFRLHARYGEGAPDPEGLAACAALKEGIARLSAERVREELLKLLVTPGAASTLAVMRDAAILALVLPGEADLVRFSRMASIEARHQLAPDALLRLAALAPGIAGDAERLRLSNAEQARLRALQDGGAPSPAFREPERKVVLYQLGSQTYGDAVRLAWASSEDPGEAGSWLELLALPQAWSPPPFPVTGDDLLARGMQPGPEFGETLKRMEDWWIASGFAAGKTDLLAKL